MCCWPKPRKPARLLRANPTIARGGSTPATSATPTDTSGKSSGTRRAKAPRPDVARTLIHSAHPTAIARSPLPQPRRRDNRSVAETNVETARRGFEAALRGALDAIGKLLDADVKWHGGDPSAPGACRNRDEALAFIRQSDVIRGGRFE